MLAQNSDIGYNAGLFRMDNPNLLKANDCNINIEIKWSLNLN